MLNVKMQSSDNEILEVDVDIAKCSLTVKAKIEELGPLDDMVVLPKVRHAILSKVFEWVAHHHLYNTGLILKENDDGDFSNDYVSPWDRQFLNVEQRTLLEIIIAASYLKIRGLLNVACKYVAGMFKGKTSEENRATFNIVNNFSQAEDEVRRNVTYKFY